MRSVAFVMVVGLVALTGCPSDDAPSVDAGGACTCTPPTAEQVSYDHATSTLGASNAQDAIDELAARPVAEAPLAGRLERLEQDVDNPGTTLPLISLACPHPNDVALGGSCGPIFATDTVFRGFYLDVHGIGCNYAQPSGTTAKPTLVVRCLHVD